MNKTTISCPQCAVRNRIPVTSKGRPRCAKCSTDLPWLADVTATDFHPAVASGALPTLVDLWAPWCGPCRAVAPALVQLAAERAGKLRILKLNVDDAPAVSAELGVKGIPTMILFRDGEEVARQVGALPGPQIGAWIDHALGAASRQS